MVDSALTSEQEPLAEALAIHRLRGDAGPAWIAARIGELVIAGDDDGVQRFKRIAAEYQRLLGATLN